MKTSAAPSVDKLIDEIMGYRKAKVLMVGAHFGLFAETEKSRAAPEIARRLKLDPRACEILLDALAAMGYLAKRGRTYRNAAVSSTHLVPGRPGYVGDNLKYQELIWDAWGELRRCVRKGGAVRPLEYWLTKQAGFTQEYIRGMDNIARGPAAEIAGLMNPATVGSMLDVGAGPGTYSLAFLRANPRATATLLDLPGTLKVTRGLLARSPELAARARLRAGNYRRADFGSGLYDLVLMSHITHDESPEINRLLARKCFRALRPGGRVVVHDFLVDDSRTTPEFGALFSVHMLAYTDGGRTYTGREYAGWLRAAGFTRVSRRKLSTTARNATEIVVGVKPGR